MTPAVHGGAKRRPGRPRRAEAADTKTLLRDAALRLFARHGFAGTSIRAIAAEVGLSESVLYAHFAGKQAVFEAVLAEFGPRGPDPRSIESGLTTDDPARFLRALVEDFLDDWDREPARLLMSLMARDGLMHGPELQQALTGMRGAVAKLFEHWIGSGRLPGDLGTPESLALSFTGPIGLIRILHLHAEASDAQRESARADVLGHVETFLRAVFRPAPGL